jgi:hypothetical protein
VPLIVMVARHCERRRRAQRSGDLAGHDCDHAGRGRNSDAGIGSTGGPCSARAPRRANSVSSSAIGGLGSASSAKTAAVEASATRMARRVRGIGRNTKRIRRTPVRGSRIAGPHV